MSASTKWNLVRSLVAACVLLLASCSGGEGGEDVADGPTGVPQTPAPAAEALVWPTADWEVSTPEAQGMDSARLEGVADYCEEHGCRAVVVTRHGHLVWERYWGGWDKDSTDIGWSMAKSVTSALVGIAIAEGHIESVDQSAADFIEEWRGTDKEEITLRHLLSMTSGLLWNEDYASVSDVTLMVRADDQVEHVLERPLFRQPGSDWYYSSGDTELFSRILRVATGMEAHEYARQKLWDVLGMTAMTWPTDSSGQTMTYCCVTTTAREFAKFGYLYLRGGRWEDRRVIPEEWVRLSTQPSQGLYPHYGYYWWLPAFPNAPPDTYAAMGFQTKRIYVIPSLDIVAVRLGRGDETWDGNAFLESIVDAVTDGY